MFEFGKHGLGMDKPYNAWFEFGKQGFGIEKYYKGLFELGKQGFGIKRPYNECLSLGNGVLEWNSFIPGVLNMKTKFWG